MAKSSKPKKSVPPRRGPDIFLGSSEQLVGELIGEVPRTPGLWAHHPYRGEGHYMFCEALREHGQAECRVQTDQGRWLFLTVTDEIFDPSGEARGCIKLVVSAVRPE